ncbi:MAG: DUF1684 domain-containing protein [Crocinitomicaceae bacterium]
MKGLYFLLLCLIPFYGRSQHKLSGKEKKAVQEIQKFQLEQNLHYTDSATSPLKQDERIDFNGHDFFPINLDYKVTAQFEVISEPDTIVMPTSAGTEKMFAKYAKLTFKIKGEPCVLYAYQNLKLIKHTEYANSLFVPFRDETTGVTTYGGGRYLDVEIPKKETLILNFNLAYNPYCAYTTGWYCPIPPKENTLKVAVKAGIRGPHVH